MYTSIGQIAAENKQEKTGKKCDAMRCNASRCQSLNVSASNNLKSVKLFIALASRDIIFLVFLMFIFERPIQILFRHVVSEIKCVTCHVRIEIG